MLTFKYWTVRKEPWGFLFFSLFTKILGWKTRRQLQHAEKQYLINMWWEFKNMRLLHSGSICEKRAPACRKHQRRWQAGGMGCPSSAGIQIHYRILPPMPREVATHKPTAFGFQKLARYLLLFPITVLLKRKNLLPLTEWRLSEHTPRLLGESLKTEIRTLQKSYLETLMHSSHSWRLYSRDRKGKETCCVRTPAAHCSLPSPFTPMQTQQEAETTVRNSSLKNSSNIISSMRCYFTQQ